MLLHHRPVTFAAVIATSLMAVTPPVEAGCLCDWLFGKRATAYRPVYPYAPVAAGYAPTYSAGYAPAYGTTLPTPATPVQTSYYAPRAYNAPAAAAPAITAYRPPTSENGAYAAQMPAYNVASPACPLPNGYAGAYSSYYGATTPVAAAASAPVTSFYGSGNIYPDSYAAPSTTVTANYAGNYAATPQAVINPQPRSGLLGGVGSFFGSLLGTNYQTSYYRAPVTYYRPITTVSPTTGATTVVQQPCTGYENQVQRTPLSSYQPAPTAAAPGACATPRPATPPSSYGYPNAAPAPSSEGYVPQPTLSPDAFDPYASQRSTYGAYPSESPSTSACDPAGGGYPAYPSNNTAPLSGPPSNGYGSGSATGDQQPVPQPELDGATSSLRRYRLMPDSSTSASSATRSRPVPSQDATRPATPVRKARPIPAPPSLWPAPNQDANGSQGRTAAHAEWDSKKIRWASYTEPSSAAASELENLNPPAQAISEPTGNAHVTNDERRPAAGAPSQRTWRPIPSPQPSRSQLQRLQPRSLPAPQAAPRYDDSGWQ